MTIDVILEAELGGVIRWIALIIVSILWFVLTIAILCIMEVCAHFISL
jgi:hypothetical protein